ncbi:ATP-dependent DNA ligase [Agreia pratensis]|uniref:DNA ligase (ATP) n=1 Tax=Agreia pratensis TaxID=150121 RepID=A0A1X7L737_9MICO|nr:ATP-dependent DNA ligase [Agreia pratensis]SMG49688.1 ATP-dependent DNA ligase [Agreia pratensis]
MANSHVLVPVPMLAKAVAALPDAHSVAGGLGFEPKWDGFRGIVSYDGESVEITSRGAKPLTRYFPELVEAFLSQLGEPCVIDGEIVVRQGSPGQERLDWDALSQRIHPAASRIQSLSHETPADFIAFDLIDRGGASLMPKPFIERRRSLEELLDNAAPPIHLSQLTQDVDLARRWLVEFEGAGLDGVIAKPLASSYAPGKRVMLKVKHHRTADVIVIGYRVHASGEGVGSLLLGLYDDGELRSVGGAAAFTASRRLELVAELDHAVMRTADGTVVTGEGERSRFSSGKGVSYVRLEPTLVAEVRYDQMEGPRFRHSVQFERWRPDRNASSCTFDQLETPVAYDLGDVLA